MIFSTIFNFDFRFGQEVKGKLGSPFCNFFFSINDLYNSAHIVNLPLAVIEIWFFLIVNFDFRFGQEVKVKLGHFLVNIFWQLTICTMVQKLWIYLLRLLRYDFFNDIQLWLPVWTGSKGQIRVTFLSIFFDKQRSVQWCKNCEFTSCGCWDMIFLNIVRWEVLSLSTPLISLSSPPPPPPVHLLQIALHLSLVFRLMSYWPLPTWSSSCSPQDQAHLQFLLHRERCRFPHQRGPMLSSLSLHARFGQEALLGRLCVIQQSCILPSVNLKLVPDQSPFADLTLHYAMAQRVVFPLTAFSTAHPFGVASFRKVCPLEAVEAQTFLSHQIQPLFERFCLKSVALVDGVSPTAWTGLHEVVIFLFLYSEGWSLTVASCAQWGTIPGARIYRFSYVLTICMTSNLGVLFHKVSHVSKVRHNIRLHQLVSSVSPLGLNVYLPCSPSVWVSSDTVSCLVQGPTNSHHHDRPPWYMGTGNYVISTKLVIQYTLCTLVTFWGF